MIAASAPGKVVLWGEYAVLEGAPALVMAVERRARCTISAADQNWRVTAKGLDAPAVTLTREQLLGDTPPGEAEIWSLAWHVLRTVGASALPASGSVELDTGQFHASGGRKLGLGSSAALCAATYVAFSRLQGRPADLHKALAAHAAFQGGHGSGIDVTAAWHGGLLRFRRASPGNDGEATPWVLPSGLCVRFVFTGRSSRTSDHLVRLRRWQADGGRQELAALGDAAAALFDATDVMRALECYVAALDDLDRAAGLGIFSDAHRHLRQLANPAGVVYKPCGAGGGDIGAAFSPDATCLTRFTRSAVDHGFLPLALETASHGIEVTG